MPQAAAREVVGGKDAMLERIEGIEDGGLRTGAGEPPGWIGGPWWCAYTAERKLRRTI